MKMLLRTAAAVVVLGTTLQAQAPADKPAITIYPFGTSQAAAAVSRDLATPSASRALEGVLATQRFEPKDETGSAAIQAQLDAAGGLSQFNSPKQIKRDGQLQSKYLLVGFIETAEAKQNPPDKNGKSIYSATIGMTVKVYDVERGTTVASKRIIVSNGMGGGGQDCGGLSGLKKMKCLAMREGGKKVNWDDSPQKALANATNKVKDAVEAFLNESIT